MTTTVNIQAASKLEKEIADLEAKLAEKKATLDKFQTMTPLQQFADKLHETICHYEHTETCGWYYETEWSGWTHERYLTMAEKVQAIEPDLNKAFAICLIVAGQK